MHRFELQRTVPDEMFRDGRKFFQHSIHVDSISSATFVFLCNYNKPLLNELTFFFRQAVNFGVVIKSSSENSFGQRPDTIDRKKRIKCIEEAISPLDRGFQLAAASDFFSGIFWYCVRNTCVRNTYAKSKFSTWQEENLW